MYFCLNVPKCDLSENAIGLIKLTCVSLVFCTIKSTNLLCVIIYNNVFPTYLSCLFHLNY